MSNIHNLANLASQLDEYIPELECHELEQEEIADFGYSHDYVIRAVRLDSGE